jgi:hypothetical protein
MLLYIKNTNILYYLIKLIYILCLKNLLNQKSLLKNVIKLIKRYIRKLRKI